MNFKKIKEYLISVPWIKEIRVFLPVVIMLILLVAMIFNFKKTFDDIIASLLKFLGEMNKFLENSN